MKTDEAKLTQALAAFTRKPANETPRNSERVPTEAEKPSGDPDAFSVSFSKEAASQQAESNASSEKVARLREQVQNGSYNPDSKAVAAAFLTELGLV